ncbi:cellulase family glycosylhydrolase [Anaerocolumna sedimenticola]|uniref:Beta-galactosidase n=1 Tax=Anaerocolumna sedimenticola TaxID=2696063 RepID=A0A6P1TQC4_9FIRM|nr:beta-galactosidase [Anaerocolumna sedimenticola]QHQ63164.1 cellulase family glycosylhydrolase [Anaerocolumna sedimenticola]
MNKLLYGAAYYDEYMPYERLEEDIKMMKTAGINVVRIAESTWSTHEPQDGIFDFSSVKRVLDAMEEAGIDVIIGTPTYAIPTWLAKAYPDIMVTDRTGRRLYGARQIMDITNSAYRYYAERIIRKLMEETSHKKCVIGYQLDNETKHYGTSSENVQQAFVKYIRTKFEDDINAFNHEFGLDYWSNRINAWEDFPDVRGTINGSLGCEFEKFQRGLVEEFITWQAGIVNEYKREDQFITHNFDYEWRNQSFGVQPNLDHFKAAKALTISGCDIYHPTQDFLTGKEIAFGGDLIRSTKKNNYFILETQAQGFPGWVPYEGQLRLQAFSHLASGADSVMYWHWHSIHNSFETYWKGLLSHDFKENDTYLEAVTIGREFAALSDHLIHLKKSNAVAIMVSNEALSALNWFKIEAGAREITGRNYNDIVRWIYDALYEMNVECDFISADDKNLSPYQMIVIPALYAIDRGVLERLNQYVENGGCLVATFKTAFANENVKVWSEEQPGILNQCMGVTYNQFTFPIDVGLKGDAFPVSEEERKAELFMELLKPQGAEVISSYDHYNWGKYAAVTSNFYGKGWAVYIGCKTSTAYLKELFAKVLKETGIWSPDQEINFPVIIRKGTNTKRKKVIYYLNYSREDQKVCYFHKNGQELFTNIEVKEGDVLTIKPWNLCIIEEN